MKILAIGRAFTDHCHGGMAVATWESCKALAVGGHDVTLYTANVPGKPQEYIKDGVKISTCPSATFSEYGVNLYKSAREYYDFTKPYDVVISHSKAARDLVIKNRAECPVIYVNHGNCIDYAWNQYNNIAAGCEEVKACLDVANEKHKSSYITRDADYGMPESDVFNLFDAAICLTPIARLDMIYRLQFANPVLAIPNPSPKNLGGDKNGPICVISGTNQRIKGLFYLGNIKFPREVVAVGPIDNKTKGINCIGDVNYDSVQKVMQKCSLLAELSIHFSCYNTTIGTALGVGLPVVTWKVPGDMGAAASCKIGDIGQYERNMQYVLDTWDERHVEAERLHDMYHEYGTYCEAVESLIQQL